MSKNGLNLTDGDRRGRFLRLSSFIVGVAISVWIAAALGTVLVDKSGPFHFPEATCLIFAFVAMVRGSWGAAR